MDVILTTTPSIESKHITAYHGIVFGEVVSGVDFVKDFTAGLSNIFGGRSGTYEDELLQAPQRGPGGTSAPGSRARSQCSCRRRCRL